MSTHALGPSPGPVRSSDAGVYVHFPYCEHKCPYCDFNSHVQRHDDDAYASAILRELELRGETLRAPPHGLASVYFGGGTPSLWAPRSVERVLRAIERRWGLKPGAEVTLEANPGTASTATLRGYRAAGVNRFSIGCQSFSDRELKTLGRIHTADGALRAVEAAHETGARVSLDLIYGLADQTIPQALDSLERAIGLDPHHISAYTLTVEPATALGRRARLGLYRPLPDDAQAEMIETISLRLEQSGFPRYEVSSYARPEHVAVHNSLYWTGGAYLGLGAGAHSYLPTFTETGGLRRETEASPQRYLQQAHEGDFQPSFQERLDAGALLRDRLMLVFRTRFGLDVQALTRELGASRRVPEVLEAGLQTLERQGLVRRTKSLWAPTRRGFLFNDALARAMLELAERGAAAARI